MIKTGKEIHDFIQRHPDHKCALRTRWIKVQEIIPILKRWRHGDWIEIPPEAIEEIEIIVEEAI